MVEVSRRVDEVDMVSAFTGQGWLNMLEEVVSCTQPGVRGAQYDDVARVGRHVRADDVVRCRVDDLVRSFHE